MKGYKGQSFHDNSFSFNTVNYRTSHGNAGNVRFLNDHSDHGTVKIFIRACSLS